MSKLVTGPEAAGLVALDAPPGANISAVPRARHCSPHDVTVVMLDRERHRELISQVRAAGSRIKLITDGDVAIPILAPREAPAIHPLLAIRGTPERTRAACS